MILDLVNFILLVGLLPVAVIMTQFVLLTKSDILCSKNCLYDINNRVFVRTLKSSGEGASCNKDPSF